MTDTPGEFARVISCDHCSRRGFSKLLRDDLFNLPQPGYVGANYKNTGVLLVGQNPGVSPDRFSAQDREFADAQIALRDNPNASSYEELKNILDKIMPTWPVFTKHFPLAECGLELNDVAYINAVRCRTHDNARPSTLITRACVSNHFVRWLDWLEPRVVVCIGKRAHDEIRGLLRERDIPNEFINRQWVLPGGERQRDKDRVAALVRRVLPANPSGISRRSRVATSNQTPARPATLDRISIDLPDRESTGRSTMDAQGYIELFQDLGYERKQRPNDGRLMRHKRTLIPRLYFNRTRGRVYFVVYREVEQRFPAALWVRIPPQKKTDDKSNLLTVVPKAGREREAFEALLK